jgi:hypothetical protein
MITEIQNIAPFVQKQFPAFYNEDGPNFIQFVKAYYEWMDDQGPTFKARRLESYNDIDTTTQNYIQYFIDKYMNGIPASILTNKALLEKHILDVYRSKGSIEGLKLLFRLFYNLDANIYLPQDDILKTSDGKWIVKQYLEVDEKDLNFSFNKKMIKGSTSGAIGHVSDCIMINYNDKLNHIFYITNVVEGPTGLKFQKGEFVTYEGLDIRQAPQILGSVTSADVIGSTEGNKIGEILVPTDDTLGEGLKFVVSGLLDPAKARGYITFHLQDGGFGYTTHSNVFISYLSASRGSGASFVVKAISNPVSFTYNTNLIAPQLAVLIRAPDYGANLNNTNVSSPLAAALTDLVTTVGTISALGAVTSGDRNYNGSLNVSVIEPKVYGYGIVDQNGRYWGGDAIIPADLSTGNGVIANVMVISSGFDFSEGDTIEVESTFNEALNAELILHTTGIGIEEGYWQDDSGFLNSDKFIQDSDYYQINSYEVQVEKSLNKYIDILKKVMHPVGNKIFGKNLYNDIDDSTFALAYEADEIWTGITSGNTYPWGGGTLANSDIATVLS